MVIKMLKNKVAIITGAGGTLCSEIAVRLAECGVKVALLGRTEDKLKAVCDKIIKNGGEAYVRVCDVTDKDTVAKAAEETRRELGLCNYLINGAGGNNIKAMPTITKFDQRELKGSLPEGEKGLYQIDMEAFENVLKTNIMGTVIPIMEFSKQMIEAAGGSIINFASMNSYVPLTRCFAYAMSKAAVSNLTQSFAAYYAPAGIRINAIAPGFMVNERSKNYLGTVETGLTERGKNVIKHTPMERFGEAYDLVGCVKWLLDEKASGFVTGATIPIDGGFLTLGGV